MVSNTFVGPVIPDPSGQLAELIVYITTTRVDLYSHQIISNLLFMHAIVGHYLCYVHYAYQIVTRVKKYDVLTPEQLETHGCVLSTVATDDLVVKNQAISYHSAE